MGGQALLAEFYKGTIDGHHDGAGNRQACVVTVCRERVARRFNRDELAVFDEAGHTVGGFDAKHSIREGVGLGALRFGSECLGKFSHWSPIARGATARRRAVTAAHVMVLSADFQVRSRRGGRASSRNPSVAHGDHFRFKPAVQMADLARLRNFSSA